MAEFHCHLFYSLYFLVHLVKGYEMQKFCQWSRETTSTLLASHFCFLFIQGFFFFFFFFCGCSVLEELILISVILALVLELFLVGEYYFCSFSGSIKNCKLL